MFALPPVASFRQILFSGDMRIGVVDDDLPHGFSKERASE
jgi:hypothetical protein